MQWLNEVQCVGLGRVTMATLLVEYDLYAMRSFAAVNGGRAKGGTIDLGGAYVAEGELYLSSGYELVNQIGGNAFIAFGPPSPPE